MEKIIENKQAIKSNKHRKLMAKIFAEIAFAGVAIGSNFAFTGCFDINNNEYNKPSNPDTDIVQPGSPSDEKGPEKEPAPVISITFAEFTRNYGDKAVSFVNKYINPKIENDIAFAACLALV